jgi:hypothetical protein
MKSIDEIQRYIDFRYNAVLRGIRPQFDLWYFRQPTLLHHLVVGLRAGDLL